MTSLNKLFEDNYYLVVDKPLGLPVQSAQKDAESLVRLLGGEEHWNGVLHRLDTPVSGLVLWAKTPVALQRGMDLFRHRRVEKTYWAVTEAPLPQETGRLVHFLTHHTKANKTIASGEQTPDSQRAALDYKLLCRSDRYFLYEIHLLTGRTHQIRAQLAAAGAPIKGDLKYGAKRSNPGGGIHLLSRRMEFRHPFTSQVVNLTAQPPEDRLWTWFVDNLGSSLPT